MDAVEAILTRTASPKLVEPAPSKNELQTICEAALRAPDHGLLRPWRYLLIQGESRTRLGELFVECLNPEEEAQRSKLLNAPLRAPLIIVAVTTYKEHPKVPQVEQSNSSAAAVQNMSIAIHALGYSSIWRTGPVAFNDQIKIGLGLMAEDEIIGYLYVGTPTFAERRVPEHNIEDFFENWG